jgi:DNA repair protein RadC
MGDALRNALTASRRRLLRQQLLGAPELFGDPAWEMLVDLFIHACEGKDLSITALCVPVKLPLSSALRLVQKLADAGIVQRIRDPVDGRRTIVRLEPAIVHRLRAYFAEGSE